MLIDTRDAHLANREQLRLSQPTAGIIKTVFPEAETFDAEVSGQNGSANITVSHPYFGVNSWLRCMPEVGTTILAQKSEEPAQQQLMGYVARRQGELVKKSLNNEDTYLFRELRPGEIEAQSVGRAYAHWSEDGDILMLAGLLEHRLSRTQQESTTYAPTHRRRLPRHDPTLLAHEERFGAVKRKDSSKPYSLQEYKQDGTNYQYEYGRWIYDDAGKMVSMLHEGHTYDESGNQIKQGKTNRLVRLRRSVGHRQTGTITFDVDEDLNLVLVNTSKAKTTDLDFGGQNKIKLAAKQLNFNISQSSTQSFTNSLTFKAAKIRANSTDVGFGSAPTQPAVLGNNLSSTLLTPMIQILATTLQVAAADPALSVASGAFSAASSSLSALTSNISGILSSQVKLTA